MFSFQIRELGVSDIYHQHYGYTFVSSWKRRKRGLLDESLIIWNKKSTIDTTTGLKIMIACQCCPQTALCQSLKVTAVKKRQTYAQIILFFLCWLIQWTQILKLEGSELASKQTIWSYFAHLADWTNYKTQIRPRELQHQIIVPFGVTYEKIGTIQRRLAWPLHKDDTLSRSGRSTDLNIYFILFPFIYHFFSWW